MAAVLAPELDRARDLTKPSVPTLKPAIRVDSVVHRFDEAVALDSVSLEVAAGSIHALLGPNGAGKTTLLRILAGLLVPSSGAVQVLGCDVDMSRSFRRLVGLVPSGDRSFYLRISGLENLVFFARLQGLRRRDAMRRAREVLAEVDLADEAAKRVGLYSHGMQKRLSVARALLTDPPILLVDEATHDLDPDGARRVRDLVVARTAQGAAVVWTTQRLEEIRGLADVVTLLSRGHTAFAGTVPQLMAHAVPRRYVLRLQRVAGLTTMSHLGTLAPMGKGDEEHYVLHLADGVILGDALARLTSSGVRVLACREERSEIEEAFLSLAGQRS